MSLADDLCPICGQEMLVYCSGYRHHPFVDGKKYEAICQLCGEVPKMAYCDDQGTTWFYKEFDPQQLCSLEELMSGGWTKEECKISLDAVKASIRKNLKLHFKRDAKDEREAFPIVGKKWTPTVASPPTPPAPPVKTRTKRQTVSEATPPRKKHSPPPSSDLPPRKYKATIKKI